MSDAAWSDLIEYLWLGSLQSGPMLLLALLLDRVFVRCDLVWPRRVVWATVLVDLLLPPGWVAPWQSMTVAVSITGFEVAGASSVTNSLATATAIVWAVGFSCVLAVRAWHAHRLRRWLGSQCRELPATWQLLARSCAHRMALGRAPRVVVSDRSTSPCTIGILQPVVVLDQESLGRAGDEAGAAQLEHVLLHEFAHVRRRDALRESLVQLLLAAWWFHPSAWLVRSRCALLRELACDATVVRVVQDPAGYCRTLAQSAGRYQSAMSAPAFLRLPAEVVQRIAVLRRVGRNPLQQAVAGMLLLLLAIGNVPLQADAASLPQLSDRELAELPGCLLRRYYVLSRVAAANLSSDPNPNHENQ